MIVIIEPIRSGARFAFRPGLIGRARLSAINA
jgi:hypothetical protein